MLQRILVATDFSAPARRAVMRAALIARQSGAALTVLHVLPERGTLERIFHRKEIDHAAVAAGAERALQQEVDSIKEHYTVSAQPAVLDGVAHRVVATAGTAFKADVLVLGARGEGESPVGGRMLGGTALKTLLRATLPVLLVRRAIEGHYYKVLAAVDGTSVSRGVLAWALEMSKGGAICQALHAFEAPFAERLRMHDVLEATIDAYATEERERWQRELATLTEQLAAADRVKSIVVRGNPIIVLMREIFDRQPDLVVVGRRRHRAPETDPHSFGSVSLRVAYDSPSDVLVIP